MSIELQNLFGGVNIGLYAVVTDDWVLIPNNNPKNFLKSLERVLKTDIHEINIDPKIIGALIVANRSGIIFSPLIAEEVCQEILNQLPDVNNFRMEFDYFALGNIVLTTEKSTLISPIVPKDMQKSIGDTLNTEVIPMRVQESDLIGSLFYANNNGAVVSPLVENMSEIEKVNKILGLDKIETSTVNRGSQFPASGIIANSKGAIIGDQSTGIETIAITKGLFPN